MYIHMHIIMEFSSLCAFIDRRFSLYAGDFFRICSSVYCLLMYYNLYIHPEELAFRCLSFQTFKGFFHELLISSQVVKAKHNRNF